jgi:uncharacterized protein DUF6894
LRTARNRGSSGEFDAGKPVENDMPIYYFDIAQGDMVQEDHSGKQVADLQAAREVAFESVLDLLRNEGKAMTGAVIEIRDANRDVVATVPVDLAAPAK